MKRYLLLLCALSCGYAYAATDYQLNTTDPINWNWDEIVWTSQTVTTENRDRYYFDINNSQSAKIKIQGGKTVNLNDGASLYSRQDTSLIIGDPADAETSTLHLVNDSTKDTFIEISNRGQVIVNQNGVLTLDTNKGVRNWNIQPDSDEPNKIHFLVDGGTFNGNFSSGSSGTETFRVVFRNGATFNRNTEANPVGLQGNTSVLFDNSTYNVWNKDASQNNGFGNHVINSGPNNQNMHIDVVFDNGAVANGLGTVDSGKTSVEYYNFVDPIPTSGLSGADLTLQIGTMTSADSYFNFSLLNGSKLSAKGVTLGRNEAASAQGTYTFLIQGDSAANTAILANSGGTNINISDYEGDDSTYKMNFLMKGNAVYNSRGNFVVANTNGSSWYSFKSGDFKLAVTGNNNTFNASRLYMLNNASNYEMESRANASFFFGADDGSGDPVATNSTLSLNGINVYNGYDTNAKVVIGGATNTFTTSGSFEFYGYKYESDGAPYGSIEFTNGITFTTSQALRMDNFATGTNEFIVSNGANVTIGAVSLKPSKDTAWDLDNPYTAVSAVIVDGASLTTTGNWDLDYNDQGASGLTSIILRGDGATLTSNSQMNLYYRGLDSRKVEIKMEGTNGTLYAKQNLNFNGKMSEDESGGIGGYYITMTGSGNTLKVDGGFNLNTPDSTGATYRLYSKSDSATNKNVIIVNQDELNWQGYYKSDLDPDEDEQSTTKTEIILAGNTIFQRDGGGNTVTLKLGEFANRQFWGGDLLLEVNGSGNEIYLNALYVGNGARLAGEDRVRIVGGGSIINVNQLRMMRGDATTGTSWANPVGGVLEYQINETGISTLVINSGINNALNGALIIDFSALADVQCINEKYVLMSSSPNIKNNLEEYWIDFANNTVKDTDLVNVISSGAADEEITFAYEQNTETNYWDFIIYYSANVPEPATCAAIFGALALAFAAYRRRK